MVCIWSGFEVVGSFSCQVSPPLLLTVFPGTPYHGCCMSLWCVAACFMLLYHQVECCFQFLLQVLDLLVRSVGSGPWGFWYTCVLGCSLGNGLDLAQGGGCDNNWMRKTPSGDCASDFRGVRIVAQDASGQSSSSPSSIKSSGSAAGLATRACLGRLLFACVLSSSICCCISLNFCSSSSMLLSGTGAADMWSRQSRF